MNHSSAHSGGYLTAATLFALTISSLSFLAFTKVSYADPTCDLNTFQGKGSAENKLLDDNFKCLSSLNEQFHIVGVVGAGVVEEGALKTSYGIVSELKREEIGRYTIEFTHEIPSRFVVDITLDTQIKNGHPGIGWATIDSKTKGSFTLSTRNYPGLGQEDMNFDFIVVGVP